MKLTKSFTYRGKQVTYDELKDHSMLPIEVQCDSCGVAFTTTKYQLVRNGHELCRPCALKLKRGKTLPVGAVYGRLTVIAPADVAGRSVCQCSCEKGTVRDFDNYSLESGTTRSCGCLRSENGKRIAEEYLSKYQKGEANWNWSGGVTDERSRLASTKEYKQLRELVIERDERRCRVCGSRENLHMHHLRNYVDNPSLFLNLDNVVTLCAECHRGFHHRYGLHDTTPEQFEEFCNL